MKIMYAVHMACDVLLILLLGYLYFVIAAFLQVCVICLSCSAVHTDTPNHKAEAKYDVPNHSPDMRHATFSSRHAQHDAPNSKKEVQHCDQVDSPSSKAKLQHTSPDSRVESQHTPPIVSAECNAVSSKAAYDVPTSKVGFQHASPSNGVRVQYNGSGGNVAFELQHMTEEPRDIRDYETIDHKKLKQWGATHMGN